MFYHIEAPRGCWATRHDPAWSPEPPLYILTTASLPPSSGRPSPPTPPRAGPSSRSPPSSSPLQKPSPASKSPPACPGTSSSPRVALVHTALFAVPVRPRELRLAARNTLISPLATAWFHKTRNLGVSNPEDAARKQIKRMQSDLGVDTLRVIGPRLLIYFPTWFTLGNTFRQHRGVGGRVVRSGGLPLVPGPRGRGPVLHPADPHGRGDALHTRPQEHVGGSGALRPRRQILCHKVQEGVLGPRPHYRLLDQ